jgi:hypothetical protein
VPTNQASFALTAATLRTWLPPPGGPNVETIRQPGRVDAPAAGATPAASASALASATAIPAANRGSR